MKPFDPDTLAQLEAGRIVKRDMLLFDFPSGLHGFWNGLGNFTYQSVTYVGAGQLISMEPLGGTMGMAALAYTCRLSAVKDTALTPDVLASIEEEQWHQRRVVASRAYFNPETNALLSVERFYSGYIDKIEHESQVGGGYQLVAYFESKARDHLKRGYRVRGDADQRRVDPSDGGLAFTATAGTQTIVWGRAVEQMGSGAKTFPT